MKPVLRLQSLPRRLSGELHCKPKRDIRILPTGKLNIVFRPVNRFGVILRKKPIGKSDKTAALRLDEKFAPGLRE